MTMVPQLTPLGQVMSYNNAAVVLAGYLIETLTGQSYEAAVHDLVLDPLGLDHSFFNADEFIGYNVAAAHTTVDGVSVVNAPAWRVWRSIYPTGGLVSSARDLLRYARFHLSNGADIEGPPVLSAASLQEMRSALGPGGLIPFETAGVGVTWWRRLTAEDVPVWQHNGDWVGQHAALLFVPDQGFAFVGLVNSDSGNGLLGDLAVAGDWVLDRFAGLHNQPAVPQTLSAAQLAPYEGRYTAEDIGPGPNESEETTYVLRTADGGLRARRVTGDSNSELDPDTAEAGPEFQVAFYRDNYVVLQDASGQRTPIRANFLPGPDGRITWFSLGGRLHRHMV
jgi:CubicO group peptidase (beta-lactamase class C family)